MDVATLTRWLDVCCLFASPMVSSRMEHVRRIMTAMAWSRFIAALRPNQYPNNASVLLPFCVFCFPHGQYFLHSRDKRKVINQGRRTYNFPRNRVAGRLKTILGASHKKLTLRLTAISGGS